MRFIEGDVVSLRRDIPTLELNKGDLGTVSLVYDIEGTLAEVTFKSPDGRGFDMIVTLDEIEAFSEISMM